MYYKMAQTFAQSYWAEDPALILRQPQHQSTTYSLLLLCCVLALHYDYSNSTHSAYAVKKLTCNFMPCSTAICDACFTFWSGNVSFEEGNEEPAVFLQPVRCALCITNTNMLQLQQVLFEDIATNNMGIDHVYYPTSSGLGRTNSTSCPDIIEVGKVNQVQ